jgi:hypothetical protein
MPDGDSRVTVLFLLRFLLGLLEAASAGAVTTSNYDFLRKCSEFWDDVGTVWPETGGVEKIYATTATTLRTQVVNVSVNNGLRVT